MIRSAADHDPGTARVLIPVVLLGNDPSLKPVPLVQIRAGQAPVEPERKLQSRRPHIAALSDRRLYQAGEAATAAVTALGLRQSRPWRWLDGHSPSWLWPCLTVENTEDTAPHPTQDSEGRSADLGLALALVLALTRRGPAAGTLAAPIVATGQLETADRETGQVAIGPVCHLEGKFRLIQSAQQRQELRGPGKLLVPKMTHPGDGGPPVPVRERHRDILDQIEAGGLTVHPIATLQEAAKLLGAARLPVRPQQWAAAAMLAAVLATFTGGIGFFLVNTQVPIPLAFATTAPPESVPTPLRAVLRDDTGAFQFLPPCHLPGDGRPAVRAGESLLVRVKADGIRFQSLHYAIVRVSESGTVRVHTEAMTHGIDRVTAAGELQFPVPVAMPAEPGLIGVIARRWIGFDPERLRETLSAAMDRVPGRERLNAAERSLVRQAPGHLTYPITVLGPEDATCPDR